MPRGRRRGRRRKQQIKEQEKINPHEILRNLIQKARNLTDKDIWYEILIPITKNLLFFKSEIDLISN